jgi:hypothetical protein
LVGSAQCPGRYDNNRESLRFVQGDTFNAVPIMLLAKTAIQAWRAALSPSAASDVRTILRVKIWGPV